MTKDKGPRTKQLGPEWNPPGIIGDIVDPRIVMGHGAGGRKMHRLIKNVFVKTFGSPALRKLADAAILPGFRAKMGTAPGRGHVHGATRRTRRGCVPGARTRGTVPVFEDAGHKVVTRPAQGLGSGSALRLGQRLGEVGEDDREPKPDADLQDEADPFTPGRVDSDVGRGNQGSEFDREHHGVAPERDRVQLAQ